MVESLPYSTTSKIIGNQILRSATSVAANYRASCIAKSRRDFINKLKIVEEEADETIFWIELIEEAGIFSRSMLLPVKHEAMEILAIIITSIKTARKNQTQKNAQIKPS
ncbi:MAG: four helix bundle protein [bacterium]